jgi:hypothetical protein
MSTRIKFSWDLPNAREIADSIVHGYATTEGTMVAFPTCFPHVTVPVPIDESRITAMDTGAHHMVYAGTSGYASHLLVGMFHGITGIVMNMGKVPGGDQCAAICCGQKNFVAMVNGPRGGQLVVRRLEEMPFDLIQEWHVCRHPYTILPLPFARERVLHAVATADRAKVAGVTEKRIFTFDFENNTVTSVAELPGKGRIVVSAQGGIFGPDQDQTLWHYNPASNQLKRKAVPLPAGSWDVPALMWSRALNGVMYTVDGQGKLFSFDETMGFSAPLATIPLQPVGALATTCDGRLFVSAGEGMARMYCFDPRTAKVADLGVAVSVIQQRRYGYCFGDAVTGRDGEIVFGENDNLGHLWLYFPRILPR